MSVSDQEIDDIVRYYVDGRNARAKSVQDTVAAAKRPAVAPRLPTLPGAAGQPMGSISDVLRSKALGGLDTIPGMAFTRGVVADALEEDKTGTQAPQNLTQWILNALGTGANIGANVVEGVASAAQAGQRRAAQHAKDGDVGQALSDTALNAAEQAGAALTGAGRGALEGLSLARFDHDGDGKPDRPLTHGQNLENFGAYDTLDQAKQTNPEWAGLLDVAKGSASTIADLAGDPFTYLTAGGTGAVAGLRGAARAAGEASRLNRGVRAVADGAKPTAEDLVDGVAQATARPHQNVAAAAARGFSQGRAAWRAQAAAALAAKQERRAVLRAQRGGSAGDILQDAAATQGRAEGALADQAATVVDDTARKAADTVPASPTVAQGADDVLEQLDGQAAPATISEASPQGEVAPELEVPKPPAATVPPDPRLQAANELLPGLRSKDRLLGDAGKILAEATKELPGGAPREFIDQLRHALTGTGTLAETSATLKTLKATKAGKALLAKTGKFAGKEMTFGEAIEAAAARRLTGALEGGPQAATSQQLYQTLTAIIDRLSPAGKAQLDAPALGEALAKVDGLTGDVSELTSRLMGAPEAQRAGILQEILTVPGDKFASFGDAITAAANGQVEASMMRTMLRALGIPVTARTDRGLANALGGRGKETWDQIIESIPTPREVEAAHDISREASDAAATVDLPALEQAAGVEAREAMQEAAATEPAIADDLIDFDSGANPNPVLRPKGRQSTITSLLNEIDARTPFDDSGVGWSGWFEPFRRIIKGIAPGLNKARNAAGVGLTGQERAVRAWELMQPRLHAVGAYARNRGQIANVRFEEGGRSLYVGIDQLLEMFPDELVRQGFFDLNYRKSSFGAGKTPEATEAFKGGLSVYGTTLAKGALAVLERRDPMEVMAAVARSDFEKLPEGQAALQRLAEHMRSAEFQAELRDLNDAQEIIALAYARKAADEIVAPLARRFMDAVGQDRDRAEMLSMIRDTMATLPKIQPDQDASLLRDLVAQRTSNGILRALGDDGVAVVRADQRTAAALGSERARSKARVAAADKPGGRPNPKTQRAERAATAKNGAQALRDQQDAAAKSATLAEAQEAAELTAEGIDPALIAAAAPEGYVRTAEELLDRSLRRPFTSAGQLVGHTFEGSYGHPTLHGVKMRRQETSFEASRIFAERLNHLALGKGGWADRLARPGEKRLPDPELHATTGRWLRTLAVHSQALERKLGRQATDGELAAALAAGRRFPGKGAKDNVAPLPLEQIEMAMQLYQHGVKPVFGDLGIGVRSGVLAEDLATDLKFHPGIDAGQLNLDRPLADSIGKVWWNHDWEASEKPLDAIFGWHKAIETAHVRVAIGQHMSALLDHRSLVPPRPVAELVAEGWRRLPRTGNSVIAHYVDPDSLFPPELFDELTFLEAFLRAAQKPAFGPVMTKRVMPVVNYLTGILKASQTILVPGHHLMNVLGNHGAMMLAGRNPAYSLRSIGPLRAVGALAKFTDQELFEAAGKLPPELAKFASGRGAKLAIGGKARQLTDLEVAQLAREHGVLITAAHGSDDLLATSNKSVLGRAWVRAWQKWNPGSRAVRGLSEFSAIRDNVTRVGHFIAVLESRAWKSLDEAVAAAGDEVAKFQPTILGLSNADKKYTRRVFLYHTWVRLTAGKVIETALERPTLVRIPSTIQYNMAEANGLEPDSYGDPFSNDEKRTAAYMSGSALGPTFEGGLSPLGGTGDLAPGEQPHDWGFSLGLPQIDALEGLFGGIPLIGSQGAGIDAASTGIGASAVDNLNSILTMPFEWFGNQELGGHGQTPQDQGLNFFFKQTGSPYRIAQALGYDPKNEVAKMEADPRADPAELEQLKRQKAADASRYGLNWWTGGRFTDYTNPTVARVADRERMDGLRANLKSIGLADNEIDAIVAEQRALAAG